MFDYVEVPPELGACPYCGAPISGFQSKDGECWLETVPWHSVNRFYASCDRCKRWVEYVYGKPNDRVITDYYLQDPPGSIKGA